MSDLIGKPDIHLRMSSGWTIRRSDSGRFLVVLSDSVPELRLTTWTKAFDAANLRLRQGASLEDLRGCVLAFGNDHQATTYLRQMERLCRMGLIEFPLIDDGKELAVIVPQQASFVPTLAPEEPDDSVVFHRFACLRRDGGSWLVESPLSGAHFRMKYLAALDHPLVRRALDAASFLEPERQNAVTQDETLLRWGFHDLTFHANSRKGWHRDPEGSHLPMIGEVEPAPARRPAWPGPRIPLPSSQDRAGESFTAVVERRRSERDCSDDRPITVAELGALLDRAARSRSSQTRSLVSFSGKSAPFEVAKRPSPSAGAIHELEIYPVVRLCAGLHPGMYHYDSWQHALVRIPADDANVSRILQDAGHAINSAAKPQVVLAIAARFPRVFWKYHGIGYGNILRNVGALYQTLYLAATDLGLAACAVGWADSTLFARTTGLDPFVEGTVGDFVVGSRRWDT